MNENRQIFVNTYLTNGYNATQAYKTAYPNCKSGHRQAGSRLLTTVDIKQAVNEAVEYLKVAWKDRINQVVSRLQREMDGTVSISSLCLLANAQKGYLDMQAKNQGEYAADNEQKAEQQALSNEDQAIFDDYMVYRRRMLLKEA